MSDSVVTPPREGRWRRVWPYLLLTAILAVWLLPPLPGDIRRVGALLDQQSSSVGAALIFGAAVGSFLFRGLVAWFLLHLLFVRADGRGLWPFAKRPPSPEEIAREREEFEADEAESRKSSAALDASMDAYLADPDHATFDLQPVATGAIGALEAALRRHLARVFADQRTARVRMNAIGGRQVTPDELMTVEGVETALANVRAAKSVTADYLQLAPRRLRELRADLAKTPAREIDKRIALAWAKTLVRNDETLITHARFAADEELLAFLRHTLGRWRIRDGLYRFDRPGDQSTFTRHLMKRQSIEEEMARRQGEGDGELQGAGEQD